MGLSLCFVCNLGAIRDHFRRVFGSVVRGVVSPLKTKEGRWLETTESNKSLSYHNATQRIAIKTAIFIKPRKFCIPFSLHGDRTAILVWQNSKNIQLSAIFPCAGLLAWTPPLQAARILHSHWSIQTTGHAPITDCLSLSVWPCPRQKAQRTGRSQIAECFSNFLKPELPFDRPEGWMGCRNYVALQIWLFTIFMAILCIALWHESDSLDSIVSSHLPSFVLK